METLIVILLGVLFIRWVVISKRFKELDRKIEELSSRWRGAPPGEATIHDVAQRVANLEALLREDVGAAAVLEVPTTTRPVDIPPGQIETSSTATVSPQSVDTAFRLEVSRRVVAPSIPAKPSILARLGRQILEQVAHEEWEAIVGGSWLNKLGVLVLVFGLALFLAYSLKYLGPAGRVAVGFAVSVAMLGWGVVLERRVRYVIFARGLIGGGWAAVYATTYAMHGLEAARVVRDPLIGMVLLGTVAAGMILHSLHYKSEVVTGLAYFVGFVTVAISPVSSFSVLASVPLVGSLLVVAHQFAWIRVMVAGVIATYGMYAVRYTLGPHSGSFLGDFVSGQFVLAVYWVLFEAFDLLGVARRRQTIPLSQTIFPLNACGFIGVSLLQWSSVGLTDLHLFFAAAAAAYLASTVVRARIRPPSSFDDNTSIAERALLGGYESAVTIAVALATPGIFLRYSGLSLHVALLLEAEFLFLAGLRLGQPYLRTLSAGVFWLSVVKLLLADIARGGQVTFAGMNMMAWTSAALLTAVVLSINRSCIRPSKKPLLLLPELAYSYGACALLVLVLGFEIRPTYVGIGWLVLAFPLFEIGLRKELAEFRYQAYAVAALGFAAVVMLNMFGTRSDIVSAPWMTLGLGAILTYAAAARAFLLRPGRLPDRERLLVRDVSSAGGTVLVTGLIWHVLPAPVVAVAWGIVSLLLIELGFVLSLPMLRLQGNLVGALAYGRLFLANFTGTGETAGISHRVLTVSPLTLFFYYLSAKLRKEGGRGQLVAWESGLSRLYLYAPALLVAVLIRFEAGPVLAVVGWSLFALGLLFVGIRWKSDDLRWQSYVLALLTFLRSWATNFHIPDNLAGAPDRVLIGAVVVGSLYAGQFLCSRCRNGGISAAKSRVRDLLTQLDQQAATMYSILATTLLTLLLFYEVSGRLLTVAWGLEGLVLLVAGFLLRQRVLRLLGLLLLGVCILKVFVYDLRQLDALARILSFVVLGVVLLGVSLIYTRYREQLRRYL